ncbi:bifunctional glycosyltransferase family 2/GtrA family protein [Streptacidiphilus fuscans]|uniref:dolichyl-phosphate beta-glucosyltransferase n=1 Tax=Streptacidiphilus fuscans TaxID=2789292 RepID=A0A931FFJ1_9ACTN|nr:bifunctional glycosyltransferase family 2/GtrA family protein [Streptacidiphilus fuscans]MBF9071596.1 bifunctional glycosyltransferase family 2/GtrA family protein [Streptacidiphilus fuscans]MBF9072917.1 bifunctional glycosyltransferase family 2/GtrA family protein [Streptacidiphilus fuscans]
MNHSPALAARFAAQSAPPGTERDGTTTKLVEVVVPVYNEEHVLAQSIRTLHGYLRENFPYRFRITIADNASTDRTRQVADELAADLPDVRLVHLDQKGRGRALRHVWGSSDADVVSYMDVDLSTGLEAFLPLVAPLLSGHSDLAIGSRLHRGSAVVRGPKREIISRTYNFLLRATLAAKFSDAQCGFKAARTEVVQALLAEVEDETWFFDTELLLLAERSGLRIHEVPVDWIDDPDSRVDIVRTVKDDLKGMWRVGRKALSGATRLPVPPRVSRAQLPTGMRWQLSSFAVIGVLSTLAYLVLYLLLRQAAPAELANAVALFVTAIANTAANRRFTFGVTGSRDGLRHQVEGGIAFLIGLVLSTLALALAGAVSPHASHLVELVWLVAANGLSTVVRFVLLRAWVFHPRRAARQARDAELNTIEQELHR